MDFRKCKLAYILAAYMDYSCYYYLLQYLHAS